MTDSVLDIIKKIIIEESSKIENSFKGPSYHAIQHILRRLDFIMLFYQNDPNKSDEEVEELREFYKYGWAPAIKPFYENLDINVFEPFPEMFNEARKWADMAMQFSGKLAFLKQLLAYEKANLIELKSPKLNEFSFNYINDNAGKEYYDSKSKDFYKEKIVEKVIEDKKKKDNFNVVEIKEKLKSIIKNPSGKYISYDTTPEIDEYYSRMGHYQVWRLQGYDEFSENDTFGGIQYWKYLDLIEAIVGVAIMHTEACLELTKMNPKVDLDNLLSYTYFKDKTLNIYKNYFGCTQEEIEQIFSCISLNKENFAYYLDYPAASLPMFVQVSDNMLVRLISGCLGNPFELFNRELKRKFKKDYDIAVNNREDRFRTELFHLFPHTNIIKIPKGINITLNGQKTDIDAIVYDTVNQTLGLFQLKWQDPFYSSMKERYSRISNLFNKANEWIEKVGNWLNATDSKTIINSLQIDRYFNGKLELNEVYIFVLARNNINFTNVTLDDRVAWGTWYQLIESQSRVKAELNNPIKEAFIKLKILSPENRMKEDSREIPEFETQIGKYRIYSKKKSRFDD